MTRRFGETFGGFTIVTLLAALACGADQPGNTAHPGGKLPGNVAIQLIEVAGGLVDPIHVTSPKDGTGRLFVASIESRDFPVMLAVGMLIVVGVVIMNLLADIGYAVVNPQIRHRS